MGTTPVSNAERKRQARAKLLVEQQRAQKAEQGSITPFRIEELYWKNRTEEPDWNLAFHSSSNSIQWDRDPSIDPDGPEIGVWKDRNGNGTCVQKWHLDDNKEAYCFPDNPGKLTYYGSVSD